MPTLTDSRCWSLSRCRRYFEDRGDAEIVELIDSGDLDAIHDKAETLKEFGAPKAATVLIVAAARIRGGAQ